MQGFSLNSVELHQYLHSRYPFLMIDHVDEVIPGKSIKGYKNISLNEWFFRSPLNDLAIMPQTIQLEALEEMLALTVLTLPGNKGMTPRFLSASVSFTKDVVPGDRFAIEARVISWKRGILKGFVIGYVNESIACEADMMVTIPEILNQHTPIKSNKN
jgi:3-hydroxyacyl-[acyl-carrier-protein] dehydratase